MTELEKDICNLRSGLKSVESVSHKDAWCLFFCLFCSGRIYSFIYFSIFLVCLVVHRS